MAKKKAKPPAEQAEIITSITRTCRGPLAKGARAKIDALLAEGEMQLARELDTASRQGCGYDFNRTVLEHPLDGASHETECPSCGVLTRWTAPIFAESASTSSED